MEEIKDKRKFCGAGMSSPDDIKCCREMCHWWDISESCCAILSIARSISYWKERSFTTLLQFIKDCEANKREVEKLKSLDWIKFT